MNPVGKDEKKPLKSSTETWMWFSDKKEDTEGRWARNDMESTKVMRMDALQGGTELLNFESEDDHIPSSYPSQDWSEVQIALCIQVVLEEDKSWEHSERAA